MKAATRFPVQFAGQLIVALAFAFSSSAFAEVIEFHIKSGTGSGSWNKQEESIKAKLGDTIRFYNDDTVGHQLHTNGAPCNHGPYMPSAGSSDCKVKEGYSSRSEGPLYDHGYGKNAQVWIEVE